MTCRKIKGIIARMIQTYRLYKMTKYVDDVTKQIEAPRQDHLQQTSGRLNVTIKQVADRYSESHKGITYTEARDRIDSCI